MGSGSLPKRKIVPQNDGVRKIYVGKDLPDSFNYSGSADSEVNANGVEFIRALRSNNPDIATTSGAKLLSLCNKLG